MFKIRQNDNDDVRAANFALIGLICLFVFVVLFIFISMNLEMAARLDLTPATLAQHGITAD